MAEQQIDPAWVSEMTQFKDEFDARVNYIVQPLRIALVAAQAKIDELQNQLAAQQQSIEDLAAKLVGTAQLADGAVTEAKIAAAYRDQLAKQFVTTKGSSVKMGYLRLDVSRESNNAHALYLIAHRDRKSTIIMVNTEGLLIWSGKSDAKADLYVRNIYLDGEIIK